MIEMTIDSIRVSLMSQHRVVVLREVESERYLTVWVGPNEADAITVRLQDMEMARPMTHDLLYNTIHELDAQVIYVCINAIRNDVFYAVLMLEVRGQRLEIDSRPSDAIALAVRAHVPIYVLEDVLDQAGAYPDREINESAETQAATTDAESDHSELSAFAEFMESLDFGDNPEDTPGEDH